MSESAELGEAVPRELSRLIDAGWVVAAFAVLQRGEAKQELRDAAEQVLLLSGLPTNTRRNDEFPGSVPEKRTAGPTWTMMYCLSKARGHASSLTGFWTR